MVNSVSMRRLPGAERGVDELLRHRRLASALVERGPDEPTDEVLLAGDAPVIRRRILTEAGAVVVLEMAGAGIGDGGVAVEGHATGLGDVEARVVVLGRVLERNLHPAEHVHQALEGTEAGLHVVVDVDAEVGLDRRRQPGGGVVAIEGRVDLALVVGIGDLHPQVARQRQDRRLVLLRVDSHHHDRVGPVPRRRPEGAGVLTGGIDAAVGVGVA